MHWIIVGEGFGEFFDIPSTMLTSFKLKFEIIGENLK